MANKTNLELWADIRALRAQVKDMEMLKEENDRLNVVLDDLQDRLDEAEHRAEKLAYQVKTLEATFAKRLLKGKQKAREEGYVEGRTAR